MKPRKVGIIGFGNVGKYLYDFIQKDDRFEVAFVWNRTKEVPGSHGVPDHLILDSLEELSLRPCDLIVEAAHPDITKHYGAKILRHSDYLLASPTALADEETEEVLREAVAESPHGLYIPVGALWGAEDIRRMADAGTLQSLTITMTKHPSCFRLEGEVNIQNQEAANRKEKRTLYDGPVRSLCRLAPNNVNTMACAAIAAHNLGFDRVRGVLISDPQADDWHVVRVEVCAQPRPDGKCLTVVTERTNPADPAAVTGSATYVSFINSLLAAHGKGPGFHIC